MVKTVMRDLSISILNSDFTDIKNSLNLIKDCGVSKIHFDIMDGIFVPNLTFGAKLVSDCRPFSDLIFDVHLMINNPEKYLSNFVEAGSDLITFHYEATKKSKELLKAIKSEGVKAGISVKPDTPIKKIYPLLEFCDLVLVMTVEPGFGKQSLIPSCVDKIKKLNEINDRDFSIYVDGGVNKNTIDTVFDAGVDTAVVGSAFFNSENKKEFVSGLLG